MPPTETSTATATATATVTSTAEATTEPTPPAEVTAEVTIEATAEVTAEATAEAPTITPTASETPLPPEPNWVLLSSGDFEQGAPPHNWFFAGWRAQTPDGAHAWGPRSFGGSALYAGSPLLDSAVQLRVRLSNGIFAFGLRQSEAGGYTATFEESGFLRLYRNEQEAGQMFLGPIAGQWRTLRLSAAGDVVRVFLDGAELITFVDDVPLPAGQVTIGGRRSRESRFAIDDLSLWAAEGEAGMSAAAAFAAPLALAAPMAFGSESASAAGRMPSTLAWSDAFGYDSNDLTLVAPDGTLAEYPGLELAARQPWSPDGQWLLVRMNGNDGLGILNPQTGETRMLTTLPALDDGMRDECPAWSPDGAQVVFMSRRRDGPVPVGGGWTWYPPALYAVGVNGQTAPRRIALSTDPDGLVLGCPQWSAVGNGQQIVSLAYQDIYAVDALTGSIVTLYHDDYDLANKLQDPFTLSPDGTKVAFGQIVAAIDVPSNVSVLDLQTGQVTTAAEEKFGEGDSSYFGHWALYTSWDWDDTGTRLAIGRDRMVENPTGFGWAYSRDIVISDLAQPCPACSVISVPNSQRTVYVETVIPNQAGVTWSPDGRWIAAVDTLPWNPGTGGDALAQLVVLDPVCAERLTVTEPQVWTNTYQGWGGFALVAWQPLPAGSGGMMAFGVGDEYCVPVTPTPEPAPTPDPLDWYVICTLRPNEPLGDIEVNVRDQPNLTTSVIVGTLGAGERVHRISLDPTDEVPFGPNVVFALVSYNWDEFVNGVPFVRHTEAWVARKDYYGALLVQPRPPECPPITPTPTPTLPPPPTPTPDPRVPLASPGRFDDAPNAPNGFQSLFEDGEAPANVGSLGIHGKGTIDVMPASLEECIDTNTYSASIGCDPEGTTQGIPIYAPVDGNAYAVDGGVNVAIWWETEARRTDVTDGEAVVVRREIFLSHLDPATTTPFLTVRSVRRGDLIGFLCLHLDRERCNIPIPQRDQRDRETNFTVNHLAVQVRFYNSSNVVYPPLDSEVLGVLAIPNCIFDSWAEDHLSPPTPKTPGAPGTLAACPS